MPTKKKLKSRLHAKCSGWCTPTLIYITLSLFGLFLVISGQGETFRFASDEDRIKYYITTTLSQLFWVLVLYALCSRCHTKIAWFILFLPILIIFLMGVLITGAIVMNSEKIKQTTTTTYSFD